MRLSGPSLLYALVFALATTAVSHAGQIIYVDAGASEAIHDGSTWCRSYLELQDAVAAALPGDEIRVAQGTYKPDRGAGQTPGSRLATFQLNDRVTMFGGYAGCGEPDPDARDVAAFETLLSGDLLGNDHTTQGTRFNDNSYHVVTYSDGQATGVVLDGFTVTSGSADGTGPGGTITNQGPAVHIRNDAFKCIPGGPTLRNCTFRDNRAAHHGAVNDHAFSTVIENCVFRDNSAPVEGAGLLVHSGSATVINTQFINNNGSVAGQGGGAWLSHDDDPSCTGAGSHTTFIACTFLDNVAGRGGALWVGNATVTLIDTVLDGNHANSFGSGIYANQNATVELERCTVKNHWVSISGGGIYAEDSSITATDSVLLSNDVVVSGRGGGLYLVRSSAVMDDSRFEDNTCMSGQGGAIYSDAGSQLHLTRCVFDQNLAGTEEPGQSSAGAGMYIVESDVTLTHSEFTGNVASYYGAAFYNQASTLEATDCVFQGNRSGQGVVYNSATDARYTRCSFLANTARNYTTIKSVSASTVVYDSCSFIGNTAPLTACVGHVGGGLLAVNCLFAENTSEQGSAGISCSEDVQLTVLNSVFRGNIGGTATGIYAFDNCHPTVVNSLFSGITSGEQASALWVSNGQLMLVNSTFSNNSVSGGDAGAVTVSGAASQATIQNCIFWGNSNDNGVNEGSQIDLDTGASLVVGNSCVQNWTGSLGGAGNFGDDPMFMDAAGPDGVPGTPDDDLRLSYGSPAINAGDETWLPTDFTDLDGDGDITEPIPLDVLGLVRVYDSGVDLGAHETNVMPCPAGTFSPDGQEPCTPCSPGFAQPLTGQTQCEACNAGTFAASPGAPACSPCPPGTHQPEIAEPSCIPCACNDNDGCTEDNCEPVSGVCQFDEVCTIPAASHWTLAALVLLLAVAGTLVAARHNAVQQVR